MTPNAGASASAVYGRAASPSFRPPWPALKSMAGSPSISQTRTQNDFAAGTYAALIAPPCLAQIQTPSSPLRWADLNLDGFCDGDDIGIPSNLGYFGTGSPPRLLEGRERRPQCDGVVDGNDTPYHQHRSYHPAPVSQSKDRPLSPRVRSRLCFACHCLQ